MVGTQKRTEDEIDRPTVWPQATGESERLLMKQNRSPGRGKKKAGWGSRRSRSNIRQSADFGVWDSKWETQWDNTKIRTGWCKNTRKKMYFCYRRAGGVRQHRKSSPERSPTPPESSEAEVERKSKALTARRAMDRKGDKGNRRSWDR